MNALIRDIDPVTAEVIRKKMASIVEQIETNMVRTAYSPLIYEYKDFAVGLVDHEARLIAQGRGGIPIFAANLLGLAVADGLSIYGLRNLARGDVVICNHPSVLGQHLNNVAMYTPIVGPGPDGPIVAFMAIVAHWADVGGRVVGSMALDATEIFQEGIQYRTLKLWNKGEPVPEIYRIIESNTRFPAVVLGDVEAQLAGCLLGRDLFEEMICEYGLATVARTIELTWNQSEQAAGAFIDRIPDGIYAAEGFLDDDGFDPEKPIMMPVTVRVSGRDLTVDYSRVSGEVRGPYNSGMQGGGVAAARMAFNYLMNPDEGGNEGTYRPIHVVLPPGRFLSASPTAAMGRYNAPLVTVIDVILRAFAGLLPDRIAAGHHGNIGGHIFMGKDPETGAIFKNQDTMQGGWGALCDNDGTGPFKTYIHGDTQNVPVELQEAAYPLRVEELSLRPDSAGAGRHRGGLGMVKVYSALAPCRLNVSFDRVRCPPWGIDGGNDGVPGGVTIERASGTTESLLKGEVELNPGDRVRLESGGGGGFGPPRERSRELILRDIKLGYVSPAAAARDYGVNVTELRNNVPQESDR